MRIALIASLAAALVLAPAAVADGGKGWRQARRRSLRHLQRLAQPQRRGPADRGPVDAEQPAGEERRRDDPARPARRRPDQRVRLRRRRRRAAALPGQLPLDLAERRGADPLPVPLLGRVEHRHPVRLRPEQQRRRSAGRTTRTASVLPGPVRDGRLLDATRSTRPGSGRSRSSSGRTCRERKLPDDPATPGAEGLVLAGRAGRLPALLEEPLGPADPDRRQGRPLPDQPSDAAGVRRAGGPERHAQLRRDPPLGRLHHAAGGAGYIYDDGGRQRRARSAARAS